MIGKLRTAVDMKYEDRSFKGDGCSSCLPFIQAQLWCPLDQLKRKKKRHSTRRRGTRAGVRVRAGKEFHLMRTQQFSLVENLEVKYPIFCRVSMRRPDSARSRPRMSGVECFFKKTPYLQMVSLWIFSQF